MVTWTGTVRFLTVEEGGRRSGPPPGPTYMATAVPVFGGEEEVLPGWPATGLHFSVVLELLGSPDADGWSEASIRELVEGAPGSESLRAGAELSVLEGAQEVARMLIDSEVAS